LQKRQKLTMKLVDRYVITESPASSVLELGFCLILAGGLLDGYCKPWYVAISVVIFILVIFSVVLSLFIRRQKIVIDSRGIHYYERFLFKITKHDYPWSQVSRCYIDWWHYYSMLLPVRRLVVVTELSNSNSKYHDIDLKDFESLVFERLFYSCYVAMAKIRFTEFLPSAGCHHSVCPHYRHLARP
jgi:hypothetical protein